jgi:hypothetical protein
MEQRGFDPGRRANSPENIITTESKPPETGSTEEPPIPMLDSGKDSNAISVTSNTTIQFPTPHAIRKAFDEPDPIGRTQLLQVGLSQDIQHRNQQVHVSSSHSVVISPQSTSRNLNDLTPDSSTPGSLTPSQPMRTLSASALSGTSVSLSTVSNIGFHSTSHSQAVGDSSEPESRQGEQTDHDFDADSAAVSSLSSPPMRVARTLSDDRLPYSDLQKQRLLTNSGVSAGVGSLGFSASADSEFRFGSGHVQPTIDNISFQSELPVQHPSSSLRHTRPQYFSSLGHVSSSGDQGPLFPKFPGMDTSSSLSNEPLHFYSTPFADRLTAQTPFASSSLGTASSRNFPAAASQRTVPGVQTMVGGTQWPQQAYHSLQGHGHRFPYDTTRNFTERKADRNTFPSFNSNSFTSVHGSPGASSATLSLECVSRVPSFGFSASNAVDLSIPPLAADRPDNVSTPLSTASMMSFSDTPDGSPTQPDITWSLPVRLAPTTLSALSDILLSSKVEPIKRNSSGGVDETLSAAFAQAIPTKPQSYRAQQLNMIDDFRPGFNVNLGHSRSLQLPPSQTTTTPMAMDPASSSVFDLNSRDISLLHALLSTPLTSQEQQVTPFQSSGVAERPNRSMPPSFTSSNSNVHSTAFPFHSEQLHPWKPPQNLLSNSSATPFESSTAAQLYSHLIGRAAQSYLQNQTLPMSSSFERPALPQYALNLHDFTPSHIHNSVPQDVSGPNRAQTFRAASPPFHSANFSAPHQWARALTALSSSRPSTGHQTLTSSSSASLAHFEHRNMPANSDASRSDESKTKTKVTSIKGSHFQKRYPTANPPGTLSREERDRILKIYKEKRIRRNFNRGITYESRQRFAAKRPRQGGRFLPIRGDELSTSVASPNSSSSFASVSPPPQSTSSVFASSSSSSSSASFASSSTSYSSLFQNNSSTSSSSNNL